MRKLFSGIILGILIGILLNGYPVLSEKIFRVHQEVSVPDEALTQTIRDIEKRRGSQFFIVKPSARGTMDILGFDNLTPENRCR